MNIRKFLNYIVMLMFLISTLVSPHISSSAEETADVVASDSYADSDVFSFLKDIGVFDGFNNSIYSGETTRAEFTALCMNMAKISPSSSELTFSDVKPNHELYGYIAAAADFGAVGKNNTAFEPDRKITLHEALKIALSILGYGPSGEARGGFPYGYVSVASDIELLDSINVNGDIEGDNLIQLLYNILTADIMEITSVSGDSFGYSSIEGKNLLKTSYSLEKASGVITTAGMASSGSTSPEKYVVEINGTAYDTDIVNAERYLGLNCDVYYNFNTNTAVGIIPFENNVTVVGSSQILSFDGRSLRVICNDDNEKTYRLSNTLSFVRNGRLIAHTSQDFNANDSTFSLIDNNNDNIYDIVMCEKYEYVLAGTVDIAERVLYNKLEPGSKINFESTDGFYYTGCRFNFSDSSYSPLLFEELSSGMFLEIKRSDDGKLVWFCAADNKKNGRLTEIGDTYICIDNAKYEITESFSSKCRSLQFGVSYDFYLTSDNRIAYAQSVSNKDMQYGYLIDYGTENGIEPTVMLKLLTMSGSLDVYNLASKIVLDGAKISSSSQIVTDTLCENSNVKYQLIRYKTDSDGTITTIDTALVPTGSVVDKYKKTDFSDNSLVRNVTGVTGAFSSGKALSPICTLSGTTLVMVPETLAVGEEYDDSVFRIDNAAALVEHKTYKIDGYDFDNSMCPAVAVVYSESALPKGNVSLEEPLGWYDACVVDKVSNAITEDGEDVTKLTVVRSGTFKTYYISESIKAAIINSGKSIPKPGDVIRVTVKNGNYIYGIAIDATYNTQSGKVTVNTYIDNSFTYRTYVAGKAFASGASSVTLLAEQSGTGGAVDIVDNLITLGLVGDNVVKFSRSTMQCKPARMSDVVTAIEAGEENASYICVKTEYGRIRTLVIYTD